MLSEDPIGDHSERELTKKQLLNAMVKTVQCFNDPRQVPLGCEQTIHFAVSELTPVRCRAIWELSKLNLVSWVLAEQIVWLDPEPDMYDWLRRQLKPTKPRWDGISSDLIVGEEKFPVITKADVLRNVLQAFQENDWNPIKNNDDWARAKRSFKESSLPISVKAKGGYLHWEWKDSDMNPSAY